ncbi:hypothetical protein [Tautonia plasticadhaerens]|uniref:hypothetical protein n=1 Tax=Tautonia plasticadhaerens TaxID=2527974 RepID=UPI0011A186C6|nr:hypothetical protein [Tautonia plasticadhaerens]
MIGDRTWAERTEVAASVSWMVRRLGWAAHEWAMDGTRLRVDPDLRVLGDDPRPTGEGRDAGDLSPRFDPDPEEAPAVPDRREDARLAEEDFSP